MVAEGSVWAAERGPRVCTAQLKKKNIYAAQLQTRQQRNDSARGQAACVVYNVYVERKRLAPCGGKGGRARARVRRDRGTINYLYKLSSGAKLYHFYYTERV